MKSPHQVREINDEFLVLDDGQKVKLPMIQRIAADQPLFHLTVQEGVEIQKDGEVIGLVWLRQNCGNDPYVWRRIRVNLSEFSGALEPTGIDSGKLSLDEIEFLEERAQEKVADRQRSYQDGKITIWDRLDMHRVRRAFDFANGIQESQ